jgi:hypothetical protein
MTKKLKEMKENNEKLEWRMYFFVPYNLSPIQQAIQAGHAALEYAHEFGTTKEYINFIEYNKTWIILNGGTTNKGYETTPDGKLQLIGSLDRIHYDLCMMKINCHNFSEPDLNNALTAVCFLADERVFNYKDYPDFADYILDIKMYSEAKDQMPPENSKWLRLKTLDEQRELFPEYYEEWKNFLGGEKNIFLRNLLKGKKLA